MRFGGYDLAALYVQERFRAIGLTPGAGSSYLQAVPMREYRKAEAASSTIGTQANRIHILTHLEYEVINFRLLSREIGRF